MKNYEHRLRGPATYEGNKNPGLVAYLHGFAFNPELETGSIHHVGWFGLVYIERGADRDIEERYGITGYEAAIVCELGTGFVSAQLYATKAEALAAFDEIVELYDRFYDIPDPYAIGGC